MVAALLPRGVVSFRRDGTISFRRFTPALGVALVGGELLARASHRPGFLAGGVVGLVATLYAGYARIAIASLLRRAKEKVCGAGVQYILPRDGGERKQGGATRVPDQSRHLDRAGPPPA